MKITAVETVTLEKGVTVHAGPIRWLWVRIHTDDGLTGLGETYPWPDAEAAVVRNALAPVLLGQDASRIDKLWADMFQAISYSGWAGAEIRAISAVDMALWDVAGKSAGKPVYELLGGASRDEIRTYNTCYDHLSFLTEPVRLARSLLDSGITAMKIWPLDSIALKNNGQFITRQQMQEGLRPLKLIKEEFGEDMEVAMEFHGYWNLHCAIQIAQACEEYEPMWLEEMLPQDNAEAYARLSSEVRQPLCLSERLMTRYQYRELLENGAPQFIMPDIVWCGGFTEARKIAALADTYYLPICPHNCGGPIQHAASIHLAAHVPNLFILESVRRHYLKEYIGLVDDTLPAADGFIAVPESPGLGMNLHPAIAERDDVEVRWVS